MKGQSRV